MDKPKSSVAAFWYALFVPIAFFTMLGFPASRTFFLDATESHPFIMGFVKFALLTMAGEILAGKITTGVCMFPKNSLIKAVIMMIGHRITDTMIEMRMNGEKLSILEAVRKIDWTAFVKFVLFRTMPFFWIPAHSITFMLPRYYRVILAAFLSIVLGLLLAIAKKESAIKKEQII